MTTNSGFVANRGPKRPESRQCERGISESLSVQIGVVLGYMYLSWHLKQIKSVTLCPLQLIIILVRVNIIRLAEKACL